MPLANRSMNSPVILEAHEPLAARMARAVTAVSLDALPSEAVEKAKLCLTDIIGCAFESRDLPWSMQAKQMAEPAAGASGATIIGSPQAATFGDAAFVNAVMGHGLVREDMHSGSISHLGIAVLPALLALSQSRRVSGRDFIAAAIAGYEVGGQVGRAVMDAEVAKIHRPTGITGPVAAAAAAARLLGLSVEQATSAIALGANVTVGFNQWAHTGGSEMFFHAGFVARNALAAVRLAEAGAFASPSALDGEAGMFASLKKRSSASKVELFRNAPEILSVYHKPVPACNFAQTASQAALKLARDGAATDRIASIAIRVPRAGALYPGCDYAGPFAHILQAKMSIQYNVAAALIEGGVTEKNFKLLNDARLHKLIGLMSLEIDDEMTRAYPGKQGGEVEVRETGGATKRMRLDDVVNASVQEVQGRFRVAVEEAVGKTRAQEIEECIDGLDRSDDAGKLPALLRGQA
ncbi:MAG TPA: MmgE/PrpD family protein [Burkholderiales bacterium]|nr:MmgE/PrpD family protein [Burkholderiales bacterium]